MTATRQGGPAATASNAAPGARPAAPRRGPLMIIIAIGLGLALAPAMFQMFTRAPGGGRMLADFEPFMEQEVLDTFGGYLDTIDAAQAEVAGRLRQLLDDFEGQGQAFPAIETMAREWPAIQSDMRGMLADIAANLDNYAAVNALPPFALFPFFFLLPGLMIAAVGWLALRRARSGAPAGAHLKVLVVLGVALIAAPAVFQMFTRAPLGGEMIEAFRPIMTEEQVASMQASFLTIASFEGEVRTRVLPQVQDATGFGDAALAGQLPATAAFVSAWPEIGGQMAPMVGAMADNLDEFRGIAALPPFGLFPWFFVLPGVLVAGLALWSDRRPEHQGSD